MKTTSRCFFCALIAPLLFGALAVNTIAPSSAHALPIPGVGASASSEIGSPFTRAAANTVDGVGQTTTVPDGAPGAFDGMWLNAGVGFGTVNDSNPEITFNLGAVYAVNFSTVYNYNEAAAGLSIRGVNGVDVLGSLDGVNFTPVLSTTLTQAPGTPAITGQNVPLGAVEARFIKFDVTSNHNGSTYPATIGADFGFVGLSEVEFDGTFVRGNIQNVNAGAPSYFNPDSRLPRRLIDGSGITPDNDFDGVDQHGFTPGATMWLTGANSAPTDRWVKLNLNGTYDVDALDIWNYNEPGVFLDRQISSALVETSLDGVTWTPVGPVQSLGANATGTADYDNVDRVAVGGTTARFVRLGNPANPLGRLGGEDPGDLFFRGLSEVQVHGAEVATGRPDPFTLVTATASSFFAPDSRLPDDAVNGVGLLGDADADGVREHNNLAPDMWLSNAEVTPWIRFDLDHDRLLDNALVWNYNEATSDLSTRGVRTATIKYATAADVVSGLNLNDPNDAGWTTLGTNVPFTRADQTNLYEAIDEFFFGSDSVLARHVLIDVQTNHGDASFTGLSEVQFFGQAPIAGVTVVPSTELSGFNRPAGNTVDGLGHTTNLPDGSPGAVEGMWLSEGVGFSGPGDDADPQLTFDLGKGHNIDSMLLFNYNEVGGTFTQRGVADVEIFASDDNFTGDIRSLGIFSFDPATGDANNPGQLVTLDTIARYVRLDILSNQSGSIFPGGLNGVDFDFVGLNEVEFFGTPIPEPGTAGLLLLGLAGLSGRRRRR